MIRWMIFSTLATALFLGLYLLLFKRDRWLQLSRFYLLTTLAFSLSYPLLRMPTFELPLSTIDYNLLPAMELTATPSIAENGKMKAENGKRKAENEADAPATNMTIIAALSPELSAQNSQLTAYINGVPAGTVSPQVVDGDTLFFLTLGTDNAGEITFVIEQDGTPTSVAPISALRSPIAVSALPDRHYGTLTDPVILSASRFPLSAFSNPFTDYVDFTSADGWADDFTITIYNASGVVIDRITSTRWTPATTLAAGVYFATVNNNGTITTIKLIKK